MFWLGKLLGSIFGYMIAGPYGAIVGLVLGHYFDISFKGHGFTPPKFQHSPHKDVFFRATFTIMGYVAKADGRVSENEINVATRIMQSLMLNANLKKEAIYYFKLGKNASFNLDELLFLLSDVFQRQPHLLHTFMDIQLQAAYADGMLPRKKQRILEYVCFKLNLNPHDFFQRSYRYEQAHQWSYQSSYQSSYQQHSYQHKRQQSYQRPSEPNALEKAYRTLGVSSATNNGELKKTYRKLMSKNHPDKLISKGLSEDMIKLATQKTQEIKLAYETICKARGI